MQTRDSKFHYKTSLYAIHYVFAKWKYFKTFWKWKFIKEVSLLLFIKLILYKEFVAKIEWIKVNLRIFIYQINDLPFFCFSESIFFIHASAFARNSLAMQISYPPIGRQDWRERSRQNRDHVPKTRRSFYISEPLAKTTHILDWMIILFWVKFCLFLFPLIL